MSKKRREIKVDAVYDLECGNWTNFVVGGYLSKSGDYHQFSNHKSAPTALHEDAMASHLLATGGHTWAHFGGKYDHKWLIDKAGERGYSVNISGAGGRIVTAQIGQLHLRDSWALVPVPLKGLTESQGIHKEELDLPCICDEKCGGYCSISNDMPTAQYRRLCDYLYHDCKSLMLALESIQEFAREHDIDLGATVGSSSWRTLQRWLGIPNADMDANDHSFARRGYYGGRTQLYRPGTHYGIHEFDVSSMYPWSMRSHAMPYGDYERLLGRDAASAFAAHRPGIYSAVIDIPEMHIPPLPFRTPKRIAYPTGRVHGAWALPEIKYAIGERGCKLHKVDECIVWEEERMLFAPYVDKMFALRRKAGKTTPQGIWLKYMLNAPTGKMGSNPDKERFMVNPTYFTKCPGVDPCVFDGMKDCGRCCAVHCNRRCGAMAEHSEYIWSEYKYCLDPCALIEKAAYLTSYSRIELNRQQVSVNDGLDVVMSDTDSVHSGELRYRNLGSDLGQWENKGDWQIFTGIAPKTYWGIKDPHEFKAKPGSDKCVKCDKKSEHRNHTAEGELINRAKGLRVQEDVPIEPGTKYKARGVIGLSKGAKLGKLFVASSESRKARRGVGDRILIGDGITRAPTIEEVEAGLV